jgi:hypothetical protein
LNLHRLRLGLREFQHHLQVIGLFAKTRERIKLAADVVGLVDDLLGGFLVVPESFTRHLGFQLGQALVQSGDVKETSASE